MLPHFAVHHRTFILFCVALMVIGGISAYKHMGRLEDPEFTIKTAVIVTLYPGAPAEEVEENVTDVVERAVQRLKGVDHIRSISQPGMSMIFVDMVPTTSKMELKRSWEELRYKLDEIRLELPPETLPPMVNDDFGEVFGIVLALEGEGFSPGEMNDRARDLQRELALVEEVGRVELWGTYSEYIEIEISRSRMAELAVPPYLVISALARHNITTSAGEMTVGGERIRVEPTGKFDSLEEIGDLVISGTSIGVLIEKLQASLNQITGTVPGILENQASAFHNRSISGASQQIRLRDIATIRRVLSDQPRQLFRSNGTDGIAIALSPKPDGNVIRMGELVRKRAEEVVATFPAGFQLSVVSYQPDNVNVAVNAFMKNLYEAVIIVTIVVMIAMGWRSGLLITSSLLVVILATMCVLYPLGMVLHRTSLGSFIVALGILVDDAVVVGDLILVRMQRGMGRAEACVEGTRRAANQLLGATIVGALAFLPVYLSPDMTGEYCGAVFIVVGISLCLSWFVAMLQTPVMYYLFVREHKEDEVKDPHAGPVYQFYRTLLEWTLHHKTVVLGIILLGICAAGMAFQYVDKIFFPRAQRTQFMVDYWLPEATSIQTVYTDTRKIEDYIRTLDGVTRVASFIGSGPPRFYLPYEPQTPNSSYGQILVNVENIHTVDELLEPLEIWLKENFPQAITRAQRFALGPATKYEVEARFRGPDTDVLRQLSIQAEKIMREEPCAKDVNNNWRQKVLTLTPEYSQIRGQRAMISRMDMQLSLQWATSGIPVATLGEGEKMLPILMRGTEAERNSISNIENTPIWGILPGNASLGDITTHCPVIWADGQIHRRNRMRTMTVGADAANCQWTELLAKVRPKIESIPLPPGYTLEWGGQYEFSQKATKAVMGKLPIALVMMAIIVVALFNGLRQPMIIVLTFPLALVGVVIGLLLFHKPFGFMALVGVMSLLGMVVRNGVVLMDQIDEELAKGDSPYRAIVDASVERMRPVVVAAMTVVVGMIPLLQDPLFDSMAVTIMSGLIVATFLTLLVVPVLYMIFFRVKPE
ncbi:MAG: efflux RND transporter permease subunit [Planctomycetia bacterium]|nr:efflux RND transporter permease subunit [Planctomycetia bacterium]